MLRGPRRQPRRLRVELRAADARDPPRRGGARVARAARREPVFRALPHRPPAAARAAAAPGAAGPADRRSEEHTSELQSRGHLVCRLLLEKKKPQTTYQIAITLIHANKHH